MEIPSLAFSGDWLSLLHYEKTFFGYKSKIRGAYFLAPQGDHSPEDELQETILQMRAPEKAASIQCRYVGRREFLIRQHILLPQEIVKCPQVEKWLAEIDIQKVSLIFATAFMGSAPSSFGHTFLKLNRRRNQGALDLLDYGVNFAARTADTSGALYAWYGLLGYFPGTYGLAPYHHLIKEYVSLEGRDLWEYELNLNEEEIRRLLLHLLELEGTSFDYYFVDDNCSFFILRLLEIARPSLEIVADDEAFVIPLDSVKKIVRETNLVTSVHYRASKQTQFDNLRTSFRPSAGILSMTPKEMTTPELELMQLWVSLKQNDNFEDYRKRGFDLATERAKREVHENIESFRPSDPTKNADSARISIGTGELNQLHFQSVSFRPLFKNLLSLDTFGFWSELELLDTEIRFFAKTTQLESFRLISLQNSPGSNKFFQPLIWGVRLGVIREPGTVKNLEGDFQISLGGGWDFSETGTLRFERNGQLALLLLTTPQGLGPEIRGLFRWKPVQIKLAANSVSSGYTWSQKQQILISISASEHWDFSGGFKRFEDRKIKEAQSELGIGYSGLF